MLNKFKVVAVVTFFLMLTACSDSAPNISEQATADNTAKDMAEQKIAQNTVQDIPEYKILEDTVKRDVKRTVEVELSSRTEEEPLQALAEQIYALSSVDVKRTFIGYTIVGEAKGEGFWATTNYDPDLKVKLYGKNASDYEKIKKTPLPEGEILGDWMISRGLEYRMTAYKKDGQTYIQTVYEVGSKSDETYNLSQTDKGMKLQSEAGIGFGEYFIINEQGSLEFWNENGNSFTAREI